METDRFGYTSSSSFRALFTVYPQEHNLSEVINPCHSLELIPPHLPMACKPFKKMTGIRSACQKRCLMVLG